MSCLGSFVFMDMYDPLFCFCNKEEERRRYEREEEASRQREAEALRQQQLEAQRLAEQQRREAERLTEQQKRERKEAEERRIVEEAARLAEIQRQKDLELQQQAEQEPQAYMNLGSLSANTPQKHTQDRGYPAAPRPGSYASEAMPASTAPLPASVPDIPFAEDYSGGSSGEDDGGITSAFAFGSSNKSTPTTESKVLHCRNFR